MARKPVSRTLPGLQSLYPQFNGFPPIENKTTAIVHALREIIVRVRMERTVPFYSIREIGGFFGVSYKTVAQAYEKIEAEGLLTRVRGSQTLMQGSKLAPSRPVRGVVGIPVYLPAFFFGSHGRTLFLQLETELRRHHFVADFIFYRHAEQTDPELAERILEHHLDLVVWWVPGSELMPTIQRLRDGGCRQVIITDGRAHFPVEGYGYDVMQAFTQGLAGWQRDGIRSVVLMRSQEKQSFVEAGILARVLGLLKLDYSVVVSPDAVVPAHVRQLSRRKNLGVIFLRHSWYESLCQQFPDVMEGMFRGHRVLLAQGPVFHPLFSGKNILVDSVNFDSGEIARRIARDISTQKVWERERLATFFARWDARVDLGKVSRDI